GVQDIRTDPVARHALVERGKSAGDLRDVAAEKDGQVVNVAPDIAQRPGAAVPSREPPGKGVPGSPVAPGVLHQPALEITGLDVPHAPDAPLADERGGALGATGRAVREVH